MAKKKERTVEELEALLEKSEQIRAKHFARKQVLLQSLVEKRREQFFKFVQLPTKEVLMDKAYGPLLSDPDIVSDAIEHARDSSLYQGSNGSSVYVEKIDPLFALTCCFDRLQNLINQYGSEFRSVEEFFLQPIVNREGMLDVISREEQDMIRDYYYRGEKSRSEMIADVLSRTDVVQKVVTHRSLLQHEDWNIANRVDRCFNLRSVVDQNVIEILSAASQKKHEELQSSRTKINW